MLTLLTSLIGSLALAAPTVEEQALRAALEGRRAEAIGLLERTDNPQLRWLAGRYALNSGDWNAARRLLAGPDLASAWGRIDVAAASGDAAGAARLALAEMDAALAGSHRDALGRLLVGWARERAATDPGNAAQFLQAASTLAPPGEVRRSAEDALFRMESPGAATLAAARLRLQTEPNDLAARLCVARYLTASRPDTAAKWLAELMREAAETDAMAAARALVDLFVPDRVVLDALTALSQRFPKNKELPPLRLAHARALAGRDEAAGTGVLALLTEDAVVGIEALDALALTTSDPARRREIYLRIADREGHSARADEARTEALAALIDAVTAAPEGAARRDAADKALRTSDGAGAPALLYAAIPAGDGRVAALWIQVERFPDGGPWCEELAEKLVTAGADKESAERWDAVCSGAATTEAVALHDHALDAVAVALVPEPGGLRVLASAAKALRVSQHRVDPEALFRSTSGHPLDTPLDAFLIEPDLEWDVPLEAGVLRPEALRPRGGGGLVALTVRAGDQRATALVRPDPLTVQVLRHGGQVAIAVLRAEAPVRSADVWVQDDAGAITRVRTDARGIVETRLSSGAIRVMARAGNGLGFAISTMSDDAEPSAGPTWDMVLWDRAVPTDGARVDVQVFATLAAGAGGAPARLRSTTLAGEPLDEVPVELVAGVARARLYAQGGGRLELVEGGEVRATRGVAGPPSSSARVRIAWEPAAPAPGDRVVATIWPAQPAPSGLGVAMNVHTPWSDRAERVVVTGEGFTVPFDLGTAVPGDVLRVLLTLPTGERVGSDVTVAAASLVDAPVVPSTVAIGQLFSVAGPAGTWVQASQGDERRRWARAGEPMSLPTSGEWRICAWREACGAEATVLVGGGTVDGGVVDGDGRWRGEPTLAAVTAADLRSVRIVRAGDSLLGGDVSGAAEASTAVALMGAPAVPLRGAREPRIDVTGALARGSTSTIELGKGLPAGSRVWAFLRDASDAPGDFGLASLAPLWTGGAGWPAEPWAAGTVLGEEIAAALLEEEERLAEAREPERVDFGFSAAAEVGLGNLGTSGYGSGAGGMASHGYGGIGRPGRGGVGAAYGATDWDPRVLGTVLGAAPGSFPFAIPSWVVAADLEVIVQSGDGAWSTRRVRLATSGAAPVAPPRAPPPMTPYTWDGSLDGLRAVALALPDAARAHALAALGLRGAPGVEAPLRAVLANAPASPGVVIARRLRREAPLDARAASDRLVHLADIERAERAEVALQLAASDADRARAVATRLLREPELDPWIRSRAGLTLWMAGDAPEALAALQGEGALLGAARAMVDGHADPASAPAWWAMARSEAANPEDRAIAIHALSLVTGRSVVAAASAGGASALSPLVEPPLAAWRGATWTRGVFSTTDGALETTGALRVGRRSPVSVILPASAVPTRLACPGGAGMRSTTPWIAVAPATIAQRFTCEVEGIAEGPTTVEVSWHDPSGRALASGSVPVRVLAAADSDPADAMSARERYGLGTTLGGAGDLRGLELLEGLLARERLSAAQIEEASTTLLTGRRLVGEPKALIRAFEGFREHVPNGVLELDTAAALARAYAETGDPKRAVAATRVVLDARFKEELAAVAQVQESGLALTALKLLRELVTRYPEVPSVVSARFLAPSMLLERAEGDGDRLGYTRSSLRHTAAAELATFLLLHPDSAQAPEAATLLTDALRSLDDGPRERALAGPLARRYRDGDAAWRLSLADARSRLAAGEAREAARILAGIDAVEGIPLVALERGRVHEALGQLEEAKEAYGASNLPEAAARLAWLTREGVEVPPLILLQPGDRPVIEAHLRPGAEVSVTATRIRLEAMLLRDGGTLSPYAIEVDGLRPTASRTYRADASGDVPIPTLPDGAYVLVVTTGGSSVSTVLVRGDTRLIVEAGGSGTLVHLTDAGGRPLGGAQLWLFHGSGTGTARTDARGSAWVPYGNGAVAVLARTGDRYAWWTPATLDTSSAPPAAMPTERGYGEVLEKNARAYDVLFQQGERQQVRADGL